MHRFLALFAAILLFAACAQKNTSALATQPGHEGLKFDPADTTWTTPVTKSDEEWKKILTADEFEITRRQGTEQPYSSVLNDLEDKGIYYCVCCANPLYSSKTKFHSGTGWPSFWRPYSDKSVAFAADDSHGMRRDEVVCARCNAHLGHVFNDGPQPTGLRYCMDGVALHFIKATN
jgi:methionine-R-sulfoxide reductase